MAAKSYELNANGIPSFEALPLREGDPHHSAWGLYGPNDEIGMLNRLTPERVVTAAQGEIKTGVRVSLNWPLNAQKEKSFFARGKFHQELFHKAPRVVNDDIWTFNTQVSSQWDGFRHFAYQKEAKFYNGVTLQDIHGVGGGDDGKGGRTTIIGIQAIAEQGIVGRGILVDYASWAEAQTPPVTYDPFQTGSIKIEDIKKVLKSQGTEIHFGDILIVRSGWNKTQKTKTIDQLSTYQDDLPPHFIGVEQTEDALRFIWENFAAVAGDQPTFECWPTQQTWSMHEVLLAGWGCPIGELFDLEKLAEECKKEKRWSFFITSEPCNVPGGVASPPNILAIF